MKLWNARRPLGPSRRDQDGRVTVWSTDSADNEDNMFWAETREAAKEVASGYWDCNPADVVARRTRLGINETHYKPPIEAREFKLSDKRSELAIQAIQDPSLNEGQISEEVVRWMTEGTDPRMSPRSDCG